jgi:hypothetical protein
MKTLMVRLSQEDSAALKKASKVFGLSQGDIVRRAIRSHALEAAKGRNARSTYEGSVLKVKVQECATGKIVRNAVRARLTAEGCYDANFQGNAARGANPRVSDDDLAEIERGRRYVNQLTKEMI